MDIIRNDESFVLSMEELREAAYEWNHLCRMQRIVGYLADYYDLPLSASQMTEASSANLEAFYATYHLPFCPLVDYAYNCPIENLVECPDQAYLFLSTLAQSYEQDEHLSLLPEEEAFRIMFQDKESSSADEAGSNIVSLGIFIQGTSSMVVGDPSVPNDEAYICTVSNIKPGIWTAAVQEVLSTNIDQPPRISLLLAKSARCPYTFQQMVEQLFFWEHYHSSVTTMNGAIGLYDAHYYQDPTSFGVSPLDKNGEAFWINACLEMTLEYPGAGILPHGVVSSSGDGEGSYDVYLLRDAGGSIIAIAVDFLLYGEV